MTPEQESQDMREATLSQATLACDELEKATERFLRVVQGARRSLQTRALGTVFEAVITISEQVEDINKAAGNTVVMWNRAVHFRVMERLQDILESDATDIKGDAHDTIPDC